MIAGYCWPVAAQTNKLVTVTLNNATIQEVLAEIKKQTNIGFSYPNTLIRDIPRKNYQFTHVPIANVLSHALAESDFEFEIEGERNISIKRKRQIQKVEGRVFDHNKEPLAGVSIYHKETQSGTVTDMNGNFSLAVGYNGKVKLTVSFIGMKTQELTHQGEKLNIVMEDDEKAIDEVIITGYQTIDKRKSTVAATSVKMDDILVPNMTTIDQALEGRIPDLVLTQNSGEVGATARLRVRGTSTLSGNREPLWVLDGFVLQDPVDVSTEELNDPDYINYVGNAIQGINPQDIDRIDVLKDAAATALYGTRASNGVIVVTTKKGQVGPPQIRYSNQTKLTMRPRYSDRYINLMNSQERVQFGKDLCDLHYVFPSNMPMVGYEGAYYRYQTGQTSYQEFLNEVRGYETVNTDWFSLLTDDAITHSHTVSLSGGTENTRYYSSIGYTKENDVVNTQYVDRYTAAINLTSELAKNLKMNVQLNGNIQKKNHIPSDVKVLDYAYNTTRALPAYNPDGSLYYYKKRGYSIGDSHKHNNLYNYNIMNEINNTSNEYSGNTFISTLNLTYNLGQILDLTAATSYTRSATLQSTWYGENTNYVAILKNGEAEDKPIEGESGYCELPYGGVYNTTNTFNDYFTARVQANYHQAFGKKQNHLLTATLGYEVNTSRTKSVAAETRGFYKDRGMKYAELEAEDLQSFPLYEKWVAASHNTIGSGKSNSISGYLTAGYDYDNYFTLGASARFDASNKFGSRSNERFLPVWSASGRWNVNKTFFKEESPLFSEWDIRVSYGKTGNMLDNQTPNLLLSQGTMDAFYGEYISTVYALPNPNLRWEQTAQTNIGMDVSLFNGRLRLATDIYWKHTTDAFAEVGVSSVNGILSYQMNRGTVDNRGGSVTLSGYPVQAKDWRLYLSTSVSWAKNKVKSGLSETYTTDSYLNGTAIVDGKAINTFYSYKYLGLNPNDGTPMFDDYEDRQNLLEGKSLAEVIPMVMVESGNRDPKVTGSFYTTLAWKRLSLNMGFNYRVGSKMRLFDLYSPIVSGISSDNNVRKEFNNRWKNPGDEQYTDIPSLISPSDPNYQTYRYHWSGQGSMGNIVKFAESTWTMYDKSDLRVVSGDYLKMSNLTLRYDFDPKLLKKSFLSALRLSFTVTNVFTVASKKLDGQDPTQASFTSVNLSARPSYTFGLDVSF